MTAFAEHPDVPLLQAYLHGRLPLEQAASLDRHLEVCEECGRRLAEVGLDTYSDLLRLPATQAFTGSVNLIDSDLPAELRSHARYHVQELLGRGGMGVVYLAVHRMMHRPVALKLIRPEFLASPEAVERFRREVRAAAELSHPNIVAAYDAEEVGGIHFLVMEFADGKTLDEIVRRRGPLPVATACTLARQVALGLDHAHARGMVHRDIKPLNLILAGKSRVKILDFGLALKRSASDDTEPTTREGQMLGTLVYSAPEQRHSAGTVDSRADLYSLGATLAFLLIGDHPLLAPNWPESIPAGVRAILTKLMARSPDDRYPSAKAVAEALAPWCGSKSGVVAREEPRKPAASRPPYFKFLAASIIPFVLIAAIWAFTREPRKNASNEPEPRPAPAPAPAKDVQWTSLLDFDPRGHAIAGTWTLANGELSVNAVTGGRIAIPAAVPAEYDLRVEFTRTGGENSVGVIVVQNDHRCVFELDAWYRHFGGFQNVNGLSLEKNPTRRENVKLNNGRRYMMLVEVRRDSLRGLLDGREIASLRTDGSNLSIDSDNWEMPANTGLGLVAWKSETTFHRVEIAPR